MFENKEKISVGDVVVVPLDSIKDKERFNLYEGVYEGVIVRVMGFGMFKKYYVLYKINGVEKNNRGFYLNNYITKDDMRCLLKMKNAMKK